uniref:Hyaluronan and proteoglycan link protein 2 n=1 Tax=Sinocyclocheilus grahami TaxID=75366 RepID=A0A672QNA6_SINGR
MNFIAVLVTSASFFSWTSAKYHHHKQDKDKELKYLLEPLVYAEVTARRGNAVVLPCVMRFKPSHYRVKWTKIEPPSQGVENIVLITNGHVDKQYGSVGPRASLLRLEDDGSYRCELINGIEDESVVITLRIEGVVFPYQSHHGHYRFTFFDAKEACAKQDATLATYKQLYRVIISMLHLEILNFFAFPGSVFFIAGLAKVGQIYSSWKFQQLEHCDGGWLQDGSVRFPIIHPRERCGGIAELGVHSFGYPSKSLWLYGAYCYR